MYRTGEPVINGKSILFLVCDNCKGKIINNDYIDIDKMQYHLSCYVVIALNRTNDTINSCLVLLNDLIKPKKDKK